MRTQRLTFQQRRSSRTYSRSHSRVVTNYCPHGRRSRSVRQRNSHERGLKDFSCFGGRRAGQSSTGHCAACRRPEVIHACSDFLTPATHSSDGSS